jgi:hypothetical protein
MICGVAVMTLTSGQRAVTVSVRLTFHSDSGMFG